MTVFHTGKFWLDFEYPRIIQINNGVKMKTNYFNNDTQKNQRPTQRTNSYCLYVRNQSYALFNRIMLKGQFRRFFNSLTNKPSDLFSLSEVVQPELTKNASEEGMQTVPINMIIGSENRSKDFDNHFRPLSEHGLERWMRISDLYLMDETIPPVELIRVGAFYFVRDGHHRISVAKALGKEYIDARVTVFQLKSETFEKLTENLNVLVNHPINQN